MFKTVKEVTLQNVDLACHMYYGLKAKTKDGKPAAFALLDHAGNVVEQGEDVAAAVLCEAIYCYQRFLFGEGRLVIHDKPTGFNRHK